jgi:hypothetical protein
MAMLLSGGASPLDDISKAMSPEDLLSDWEKIIFSRLATRSKIEKWAI